MPNYTHYIFVSGRQKNDFDLQRPEGDKTAGIIIIFSKKAFSSHSSSVNGKIQMSHLFVQIAGFSFS